jgi:hypothetical protein
MNRPTETQWRYSECLCGASFGAECICRYMRSSSSSSAALVRISTVRIPPACVEREVRDVTALIYAINEQERYYAAIERCIIAFFCGAGLAIVWLFSVLFVAGRL